MEKNQIQLHYQLNNDFQAANEPQLIGSYLKPNQSANPMKMAKADKLTVHVSYQVHLFFSMFDLSKFAQLGVNKSSGCLLQSMANTDQDFLIKGSGFKEAQN